MTLAISAPVQPVTQPVVASRPSIPLSVTADRFADEVHDGAVAIDIRSQHLRDSDGIMLGALAIDAADVLDRLVPGTAAALASAAADTRWILVSDDGHDAEWLAWHLQARGLAGVRFLVGGQRGLRRAAIPRHVQRVLDTVATH